MGSPLGPTLAIFYLAQFENQFINTNFYFLPSHYCRYVDDIFHVFVCLENVDKFHQNKKLTHEIQPRQLAFIDTEIHNAICPWILKICLIDCFLKRVFNVCSVWSLLHQEIFILKNIFHQNGYRIFYNCVFQQQS